MPQIPLAQIMLDQRAQPRSALNTDLTAEYAEAMRTGAQFPPLTVFHDGKAYWLAVLAPTLGASSEQLSSGRRAPTDMTCPSPTVRAKKR